jgi:hypothetical protein
MWQLSLFFQVLMIPAVIGLTAVQEFAARGHGTPVRFDPPRRLVTTGVYAGWDEDEDLRARFGNDWIVYRRSVRRWFPRRRPWRSAGLSTSALIRGRQLHDVQRSRAMVWTPWCDRPVYCARETHPSGSLRRITYEPGDDTSAASGIEAIARSLEHIHLGWAFVGFLLRLPVVCQLAQLLADASGAEPRPIPQQ